ncbi:hypothetical protein SNEBB_002486 [Seison nebaliae]|nr:hypothetical protein SNEBB_002486 [Seison nebaliae]
MTATHWYLTTWKYYLHGVFTSFICVLGVFFNICAITVLRHPSMKLTTYIYLKALAVCDVIVLASSGIMLIGDYVLAYTALLSALNASPLLKNSNIDFDSNNFRLYEWYMYVMMMAQMDQQLLTETHLSNMQEKNYNNYNFENKTKIFPLILNSTTIMPNVNNDIWNIIQLTGDRINHYNLIRFHISKYVKPIAYSMQLLSVWLTVAFTLDRFLMVCHPFIGERFCQPKRANQIVLILAIVAVIVYLPTFNEPKLDVLPFGNQTAYEIGVTNFARTTSYTHFYDIYFQGIFIYLIPLGTLIVCNIFLILSLRRSIKKHDEKKHQINSQILLNMNNDLMNNSSNNNNNNNSGNNKNNINGDDDDDDDEIFYSNKSNGHIPYMSSPPESDYHDHSQQKSSNICETIDNIWAEEENRKKSKKKKIRFHRNFPKSTSISHEKCSLIEKNKNSNNNESSMKKKKKNKKKKKKLMKNNWNIRFHIIPQFQLHQRRTSTNHLIDDRKRFYEKKFNELFVDPYNRSTLNRNKSNELFPIFNENRLSPNSPIVSPSSPSFITYRHRHRSVPDLFFNNFSLKDEEKTVVTSSGNSIANRCKLCRFYSDENFCWMTSNQKLALITHRINVASSLTGTCRSAVDVLKRYSYSINFINSNNNNHLLHLNRPQHQFHNVPNNNNNNNNKNNNNNNDNNNKNRVKFYCRSKENNRQTPKRRPTYNILSSLYNIASFTYTWKRSSDSNKGKRCYDVTMMIIVIIVTFILCQLPAAVLRCLYASGVFFKRRSVFQYFNDLTNIFILINSAISCAGYDEEIFICNDYLHIWTCRFEVNPENYISLIPRIWLRLNGSINYRLLLQLLRTFCVESSYHNDILPLKYINKTERLILGIMLHRFHMIDFFQLKEDGEFAPLSVWNRYGNEDIIFVLRNDAMDYMAQIL